MSRQIGAIAESGALRRRGITLRAETDDDRDWLGWLYATTRADELALVPWPDAAKAQFAASQFALQDRHFADHYPAAERMIVERAGVGDPRIGRRYVDRSRDPWRLIDIAIVPAAQRGGFGTALLRALQREARGAGVRIELQVADGNSRAAALYDRLGFRPALSGSTTHRRMIWTASGTGAAS